MDVGEILYCEDRLRKGNLGNPEFAERMKQIRREMLKLENCPKIKFKI